MMQRLIVLRLNAVSRSMWLGVVGIFVLAMLVLLPLRMALVSIPGIAAREVQGFAWSGDIKDLRAGPLQFDHVKAGVNPLSLLIARPRIWLRAGDTQPPFAARLGTGWGETTVFDVNGSVAFRNGLSGLPVTSIAFRGFGATFRDGRCIAAYGAVRLAMPGPGGGPLWLAGPARCKAGALLLALQGLGGMERLDLRLAGDGRWTADLTFADLPPEASAALAEKGFTIRPDGATGFRTNGSF